MTDDITDDRDREQRRYATWLEWGTRIGLVVLVASFAAYLFGILTPLLPVEQLPALWTLSADELRTSTAVPGGWGWTTLLAHGDMLTFLGIAVLALCSLPALAAIVPVYVRRRDWVYATLCVLEVLVIALAASGFLGGAH